MKLWWSTALALLVIVPACSRAAPEVAPEVQPSPSRDAARHEAPTAAPAPGSFIGAALAQIVPARWPAVEAGLSGLLQAIPDVRLSSAGRLEARWIHLKRLGDVRRQIKAMDAQRIRHTVTDDLVDLRALEGAGLPAFQWRDRTRGRTHVTPTMAAVLIRAYATFRETYPELSLSLGDLAQPGGGTLYHGTLVRHVKGQKAVELLNRASLVDGRFMATGFRPASAFPLEVQRLGGPDGRVWVEETILGKHGADPLHLRVASRRYTESPPPGDDEVRDMLGDVARLVRRGTLVTSRTVDSWAPGGENNRVRQHWVDGRSRRQVVIFATRPQRRRLRLNEIYELRVSRYSPKKPESFQRERRWIPERFGEGKRSRIRAWRRFEAVYEAGHITFLAGRDADISWATVGNRSHFAVDVASIDALATWHWFEALQAAAAACDTSIEVILLDRSVIRHLAARLPESATRTTLFKRVLRRASGHNAHHHLRLSEGTSRSDAAGRRLLAELADRDGEGLALDVTYTAPTSRTASAAEPPEDDLGPAPAAPR
jgi:murein endopeptidase